MSKFSSEPRHVEARNAFIDWLNTSKEERIRLNLPRSQKEFAAVHKVREETVSRWKGEASLKREAARRAFMRTDAEDLYEGWMRQVHKAKHGNPASMRFVLQALGFFTADPKALVLKDQYRPSLDREEVLGMSDEELDELLGELKS